MAKFELQHDEVVIVKAESVLHGTGMLANYTDELILTNRHLIWISKNMFGGVRRSEYYPLGLVKVHSGQAQALLGKDRSGMPQLEVYLQSGVETFRFRGGGKKEVERWNAAINTAVTGNGTAPGTPLGFAIPGVGLVAGTLRGTIDQFRTSFAGAKAPASSFATPARLRSGGPCPSCGAPVSGFAGEVAPCSYCDTEHRLP